MRELRECPFCGGEARLMCDFECGVESKTVKCIKCGAKVNNFFKYNEERSTKEAVDAWNRRVSDE